jgi:hypothetical protein
MLKPALTPAGKIRLETIGHRLPIVIQYSDDLKNWLPFSTNSASAVVEDIVPAERQYRYYRSIQP